MVRSLGNFLSHAADLKALRLNDKLTGRCRWVANRSIVLISTDRLAVSRGRRATKSSHRPKNQTRARFNSAWINHGCQIKSDRVTSRRRQEEDSFTLEGIETLGGHCWAVRTQGVPPVYPWPCWVNSSQADVRWGDEVCDTVRLNAPQKKNVCPDSRLRLCVY